DGTKQTTNYKSDTTDLSDGENNVAVTNVKTNESTYSVKSIISVGNKNYKVSRISSKAFKGSKVSRLELSQSITHIDKNAFAGSKVKTIKFPQAKVNFAKNAFSGIKGKMTIVVNKKADKTKLEQLFKKAGIKNVKFIIEGN
ncbi:MAG: leucine-rich repeat protein, partial [Succinivibrio sp.]|nr:leucine-rich repeat protein [Succinivibrio sp.]